MRVLGLSDLHGYHNEIAELIELNKIIEEEGIDMIIVSGDISPMGNPHDVDNFLKWFHALPVKHKVFILGNHERGMEHNEDWLRERIANEYDSLTYLHHEHVTIEGFKIFGSPYTPYYRNWAYNVNRRELEYYWDEIDEDTDVIVTHGPPLGIGDYVPRSKEHTGCLHLLNKVVQINPQIHQFGHIHEGHGVYNIQNVCKTKFVNASCLDGGYNMYNTYAIYELTEKEA